MQCTYIVCIVSKIFFLTWTSWENPSTVNFHNFAELYPHSLTTYTLRLDNCTYSKALYGCQWVFACTIN